MIQPRDLLLGRQHGAVGDIIGVAGEGVVGMNMRTQIRADEDADGEILVAAILAGPALDILDDASAHD